MKNKIVELPNKTSNGKSWIYNGMVIAEFCRNKSSLVEGEFWVWIYVLSRDDVEFRMFETEKEAKDYAREVLKQELKI